MSIRRTLPVLLLAFCAVFPSFAQEKTNLVRRVFDWIMSPSVELDPDAVYQPAPRWTFSLSGDVRQASMYQKRDFEIFYSHVTEEGEVQVVGVPAMLSSDMHGEVTEGIGFQAGYGGLSLSLSKKFRDKGSDNRTLSFDYMSAGYAFQLQFYNLSQPVDYKLVIGDESSIVHHNISDVTENPGRSRSLILDGFYAFDRRTFAYCAAYKGSVIQRRSGGSWMLGSKLILGDYRLDPRDDIALWSGGLAEQTSAQVSVGGGYSYNFVPLHRQPYADREKGLRNLTFNATFIPMVTVFNQFTSTSYGQHLGGDDPPTSKSTMNGDLMVNYVARAGVGYTRDLLTLNLSASYDSYSYNGKTSIEFTDVNINNIKTSGGFRRWVVSLRLCKRF